MYGYRYVQVANGRYDEDRNPYRFEPGEPDGLGDWWSPRERPGDRHVERIVGPLVGYAITILVVMTLSWVFGSDVPGASAAGLPGLSR